MRDVPQLFTRLSEYDVLCAIEDAGIEVTTAERERLIQVMRAKVAENQAEYRRIMERQFV